MSKINIAVSATNCSFTLGRRYCRRPVYDKFLETEWRWFQICHRKCLQLLLSQTRISSHEKKILLNFFQIKKKILKDVAIAQNEPHNKIQVEFKETKINIKLV